MKRRYLLILLLFLTVGYAAVTSSLKFDGTVSLASQVNDGDFYFSLAKENETINMDLIKDKKLIEISPNLKNIGDKYVLDYEINNSSFLYDVAIDILIEGSHLENVTLDNKIDTSTLLEAQNKREGKLIITLNESLSASENLDIKVKLNAQATGRTKVGEVVYSKLDVSNEYIENNVPYFKLNVANYIEDKLVSPGSEYNVTIENQDGYSNGLFYFIDNFGNVSSSTKEYKSKVISNNYTFDLLRDSNFFKVFVKSSDSNNRKVRLKVTVSSPLNTSIMTDVVELPLPNICLDNGINTLSDCILVRDSMNTNLEASKEKIESRVADFSKIEPQLVYTKREEKNVTGTNIASTNQLVWFSEEEPVFYSDRGRYQIPSNKGKLGKVSDYVSTSSKKYYTCLSTGLDVCFAVYVIYDYTSSTSNGVTTYNITKADRYTVAEGETAASSPGLYSGEDDYGKTYYYRGSVANNYVNYAGFTWRITRINGDGSVRLIYSGTSPNSSGNSTSIGSYRFNSEYDDPAFVGYKYGLNQVMKHSTNTVAYNVVPATSIYFADNYTCDESTKKCKLSGNMISGTWTAKQSEVISKYKYTCFSGSSSSTCGQVSEITGIATSNGTFNPSQAIVKYHGFYSSTYEDTYKDDHNSTAKQNIDNWYEKNILNKKDANNNYYENYLEDGNFCIDRTLTSSDKTGVTLGVHSWYAPHTRHSTNKPSFKCTRTEDVFNKKNNKLKYPISMLSLDEVLFAGGRHSSSNSAFYLYTGADYFTLSPSGLYSDWSRAAYVYRVQWDGGIFQTPVNSVAGLRPVINLKSSVKIVSGDGTKESPYELSL